MELASAYPNSALSTGALMAIAFVMVGCLAFWLVMVYVADRGSRKSARQADSHPTTVAEAAEAAEDERSEAGPALTDQRQGATA